VPHKQQNIENENIKAQSLQVVWPIVLAGATLGLFLSWSVLSGDTQGRVNLLYLLLVYLFIPIISLLISIISLFFGQGLNLACVVSRFPFLSYQNQTLLRKIQQLNLNKYWFLMQSQNAALAFTLLSLMTFFVLLLVTDINFVWRSTVLNASDIYPLLKVVAFPWSFWSEAQPSLALLEQTQDSRLVITNLQGQIYASWWQFILATQLFYSLLTRFILLLLTRWRIKKLINRDIEQQLHIKLSHQSKLKSEFDESTHFCQQIPEGIIVNNWAGIPEPVLALLPYLNIQPDNLILAGPRATAAEQLIAERWQDKQLVIVKAWEPPLAELEDYLQNGQGYLLPLEWDNTDLEQAKLVKSNPIHLSEWQRLINKQPQWQLFLPSELL